MHMIWVSLVFKQTEGK